MPWATTAVFCDSAKAFLLNVATGRQVSTFQIVRSEVFDVIQHLFLGETSIDQQEVFDYLPQRVRSSLAVNNAPVIYAAVG